MQSQLVPVIAVVRPDGIGILENKVFVGLLMVRLIKVVEILDEDTFELRSIITTTLRCLTVLFVKNPLIIYIGSSLLLAPPEASTASRVPAGCHILEERLCYHEVVGCMCQVIRFYPGESPPTFIVIIGVDDKRVGFVSVEGSGNAVYIR